MKFLKNIDYFIDIKIASSNIVSFEIPLNKYLSTFQYQIQFKFNHMNKKIEQVK